MPAEGKTMNAVLAMGFAGSFTLGGIALGAIFVWITLLSEALLLLVAAQAGFIHGPRGMAHIAGHFYLPHPFPPLSGPPTPQNRTMLLGGASLLCLLLH